MLSTAFGVIPPKRAVGIGRRRKRNARSIWAPAFFAPLITGYAESAPGAAVKAGLESDEFVLAAIEASKFHGAFNRLRPAVAEKSLGESVRCYLRNLLRQIGDRFRMVQIRRAMNQLVHLPFGGSDDSGMVVSGVYHGNP